HMQEHEQKMHAWHAKADSILTKMHDLEEPYAKKLVAPRKGRFPKEFQIAYDTPMEKRTPFQKQIAEMVAKQCKVDMGAMVKAMKPEIKKEWEDLGKQLASLDSFKPKALPATIGITDVGPQAPPTFLLKRGSHKHPMYEVQPGFLHAVKVGQ